MATGIPLPTLRRWLYGRLPKRVATTAYCRRCGGTLHQFEYVSSSDYAYLLGVYLGDGHVGANRGGGFALRVSLDHKYPGIVAEVARAIEAIRGRHPWIGTREATCDVVVSYWREWPCWFPQHGPG